MNDDENNNNEPSGETVRDDDSDNTDGKSDYYSIAFIIIKLRFQEGSQSLNLTIQPLTVPDRFNKGRYLSLKGGVMDAEERGDQNALGFVSIGVIVVEKCTIN